MNNSPRIALGKSDRSLLQIIPEFRVTRNSRSMYHGAQYIKDENGPLAIRPVARKGYGAIAHETKPNGLLIRGP